jgi:hypothetical protein
VAREQVTHVLHPKARFAGPKLFGVRLIMLISSLEGCVGSICGHYGTGTTKPDSCELL